MNHLKMLKYGNYLSAALLLLAVLATVASAGATLMAIAMADPDAMVAVLPSVAITARLLPHWP